MILVGRYRSPFARRVAISLRCLGIAYEHRPVTAWTHLAEVRGLNPVGRIPALVLDSGEVLFDSSAILDYLDHRVGAARALVPMEEPRRHEVLRIVDPALVAPAAYPRLAALAARCDALPAFAETLPVGGVDQANPALPTGS